MVLRPLDVVGHHQKVAAELHLADHAALVVGLLGHLLRHVVVVPAFQALLHLLQEERRLIPAFGAVELRHERAVLVIVEHHVAPFGNFQRVVACPREFLEDLAHLLGRLQVVARTVEFETVRIIQMAAGIDAQHGVLRLRILGVHVVGIVRGQQRCVELLGDFEQTGDIAVFDGQPMIHDLDEEIVFAENVLQFACRTQCLVELAQRKPGLNDAGRAAGPADHTLGIGGKHLFIHTRVALHAAFKVGYGTGFDEVHQALVVLRPQRQVGDQTAAGHVVAPLGFGAPMHAAFILTGGFRRHIRLDADNRLDADFDAVGIHLVGAMHVAVIGDANCRHTEIGRVFRQFGDFRRAVQQRIMRVIVQMYEVSRIRHTL